VIVGDPAPLRVVVMARHPLPGRVKTRLAARIGAEAAAGLQAAFIADLAARLATTGLPVTWAVDPPDAPFEALVPGVRSVPQCAGDLGARMAAVLARLWAEAPGPLVVLGSDVPHLALARLGEAAAALAGGADVVLGPAVDGGYYLLGLRGPAPSLFVDMPWGGPTVLEETLRRVAAAGLRAARLAPEHDVDTWEDLCLLHERCPGVTPGLTRTRPLLDALIPAARR
jgi:hypothetical protein